MQMKKVECDLLRFFAEEMSATDIERLRQDLQEQGVSAEYETDKVLFLALTDSRTYAPEAELPANLRQDIACHVAQLTATPDKAGAKKRKPKSMRRLWVTYVSGLAACLLMTMAIHDYHHKEEVSTLYSPTNHTPEEATEITLDAIERMSYALQLSTNQLK